MNDSYPKHKRFEYKTLTDIDQKQLNKLGAEGWELVSESYHPGHDFYSGEVRPYHYPAYTTFTFKREL